MAVPKLRFKGFEGNWEERKLGEIAEIKDSARISNEFWITKGIPYLRSSDLVNEDLKGELFISKETYDNYALKTGAPQKDDVLFTSGGKVGVVYHKEDNSHVYVQGGAILYVRTSTSENLDGSFLSFYFSSPKMKKYMENASVGGTIKHFTLKPANATPIIFPSIKEQRKIGTFFKKVYEKIKLQQEKIDLLKEQKKGFMQEIFSQKLRFNNLFNKWEITTVSNVATLINGRAYKKEELLDQGKYRVLRVGNFFTNNSWYFSDLELDPDKYANKEDLLYAWSASFGPKIWREEKVIYHYHIWKVIPNEKKVIRDFLYHWFTFDKTRILSQKNGSTLVHITKGGLEETNIEIPCLDEQKAISDFLNKLELKISLAEDQLAILNQQKKAFMHQLFI